MKRTRKLIRNKKYRSENRSGFKGGGEIENKKSIISKDLEKLNGIILDLEKLKNQAEKVSTTTYRFTSKENALKDVFQKIITKIKESDTITKQTTFVNSVNLEYFRQYINKFDYYKFNYTVNLFEEDIRKKISELEKEQETLENKKLQEKNELERSSPNPNSNANPILESKHLIKDHIYTYNGGKYLGKFVGTINKLIGSDRDPFLAKFLSFTDKEMQTVDIREYEKDRFTDVTPADSADETGEVT